MFNLFALSCLIIGLCTESQRFGGGRLMEQDLTHTHTYRWDKSPYPTDQLWQSNSRSVQLLTQTMWDSCQLGAGYGAS